MEGGELDGKASANSQLRIAPVKVEPPDVEAQDEFHSPLKKDEIITDDVPPQMNLAPIPMKLIEAATGKLIQYQPVVDNPDDEADEVDSPINQQEPLVLIKQEPDENASEDDDCSHELPYCPTELVQTSFGTYDMPEVKCELGQDPENGKKVRLRKRHLGGGDGTIEKDGGKEMGHVPPLKIKLRPCKNAKERFNCEGQDFLESGVEADWNVGYTGHVVGCEERCRNSAEEGSTSEDESRDSGDAEAEDSEAGLDVGAPRKGRKRRTLLASLGSPEARNTGVLPRKRGRRPKSTRESSGDKACSETMEETEKRLTHMRKLAAERRNKNNPMCRANEDGSEGSGACGEGGSSSGGGAAESTPLGFDDELGEGSGSSGSTEKFEGERRRFSSETDEERLVRLKKQREIKARILANETEEEKQERLEIMRERKSGKIAMETEEQKEAGLKHLDENWIKMELKKKKAEMSKLARIVETPEERKRRLEILKMSQKKHLAKETPEQRRNRLEKMKAYQAKRLEKETPEERESRLERARKYTAQRDARKKQMRSRGKDSE